MESACLWRVQRTWYFPADWEVSTAVVGVWDWNGRDQCLSVRVQRVVDHLIGWTHLDYFAKIHDG